MAIGQKHIVVTCNYAAREVGVTKLMSRERALIACPHLLIVEGSDLERYRIHARRIYECFRRSCKQLYVTTHFGEEVAVCKGSMDEMVADITSMKDDSGVSYSSKSAFSEYIYVYGENPDDRIVLTEDQTGAETVHLRKSGGVPRHTAVDAINATTRIRRAAIVAVQIRQAILHETGFTTTLGVSASPLLAKIASGLKKPGCVNVLPPECGREIVQCMPLRKIPGIGSRTMEALLPALVERHGSSEQDDRTTFPWTCRYAQLSCHFLPLPDFSNV
jgi:DNA polymerase iota